MSEPASRPSVDQRTRDLAGTWKVTRACNHPGRDPPPRSPRSVRAPRVPRRRPHGPPRPGTRRVRGCRRARSLGAVRRRDRPVGGVLGGRRRPRAGPCRGGRPGRRRGPLAAVDHGHARLLGDVAADHRASLAALAAAAPGIPTPAPSSAAGAPRLASAVRAEWDAAGAALGDALHASPSIAALLARVAAQRGAHADLLARAAGTKAPRPLVAAAAPAAAAADPAASAPSPGTLVLAPGARDALVALTSGEHAAVFAYGVVAARVSPGRRQAARAAWSWHLARRDLLEERLLAAGVQPPVAAPAYDVGVAPDASGAARLAATVERRLAGLAVRAVAATEGDDRREAATGLVEGARRLAGWTGRPETLPG